MREESVLRGRLGGIKVLIVDDINLLSLEDLFDIDRRLCVAKQEFEKPFGGIDVILSGDFYQLRPLRGTPIVKSVFHGLNSAAERGRSLYETFTHFAMLNVNIRAGGSPPLATFMREARLGNVTHDSLDFMNRQVVGGLARALSVVHPKSIWITSTHTRVKCINSACLKHLQNQGRVVTRLVAAYRGAKLKDGPPDLATRQALAGYDQAPSLAPHYIDVCVGTRVRLTADVAPSLGLCVGVMGTVCGLLYGGEGPDANVDRVPSGAQWYDGEEDILEQPVVLVRIDGNDITVPYSCSSEVSRLIPIVPVKNYHVMTVYGVRYHRYQYPFLPAHGRTVMSLTGLMPSQPIVVDDMMHAKHAMFALNYVAVSRATNIESLRFLAPIKSSHFNDPSDYRTEIRQEYSRLSALYHGVTFERHDLIEARVGVVSCRQKNSRK
eukprot:gene24787-31165_t